MNNAILIILLILGGVLNFLPHLNYEYPLHVDEWTHFTYSKHLSDGSPLYFGGESNSLEYGFHILLASLKSLGGDYLIMFRFLPVLITILIGLSMFIMVRKYFNETAALFSVLFLMMLKSSLALLGPMFLVPMALGLFFIPIALYLVESKFLFLIMASTTIIHPPSAIALLLFVGSYFIHNWIFNKEFNLKLIKQGIIGIVLASPVYVSYLFSKGHESFIFGGIFTNLLHMPRYLGYMITLFIFIGFFVIDMRRKYNFVIYSILLLFLAVLYYRFEINILIFYERNIMFLLHSFAVPFGVSFSYFISRIGRFKNILRFVFLIFLVIFMIGPKIESTGYVYHIIDDKDYSTFLSYKFLEGEKIVLDPWKAIAFTPIGEKEIYSRIPPGPNQLYLERNKKIREFFNQSCRNREFLKKNGIDLVIGCSNHS